MIAVVLSVTPERLRGELTRWLLEVDTGVYAGHLTTRVRERLWQRIVEDVGRGRALMVWSARNEQRLEFRTHNHAWDVVDFDGIALLRRQTAESAALARRSDSGARSSRLEALDEPSAERPLASWSTVGRRRRYRNAVEQRLRPEGQALPGDGEV